MTLIATVVLLGLLGGAAATVLLLALVPERSDLVTVLRQPRTPLLVGAVDPAPTATGVQHRNGSPGLQGIRRWAEAGLEQVSWLRTPDRDLMVLQISRGQFLLRRVVGAAAALLIGPLYTAVFAFLGLTLPFTVTMLFGLLLAAVAWVIGGVLVHEQAQRRRREMRYALVGFLTLVALHRAAGEAMGQALERSARSSSTWPYRMIDQRMQSAVRGGSSEWAGLAVLAKDLEVDELVDLADIADIAGHAGAGVYSTLMARATSLRRELQATEKEAATAASTKLAIPKVLLTVTMAAFLLFPALIRLAGS